MFANTKVLLIGGGKMGSAMLGGWLKGGFSANTIMVVEPNEDLRENLRKQHGVRCASSAAKIDFGFTPDVVVVAVKPQMFEDVLSDYAAKEWSRTTYLSVAAGKSIASIKGILGEATPVVRAMPNVPALIGKGVNVAVASAEVDELAKNTCNALLKATGSAYWSDDEEVMDGVTAISGSGPAYVFYFIEAFIEAAKATGVKPEMAERLAVETVVGSARLVEESELSAKELREMVTSPNGTTAAALDVLMQPEGGILQPLKDAVAAAQNRSKELRK